MYNLNHIYINQARYKAMLKQAERERLAQVARGNTLTRLFFYRPLLSWTGRRMVGWGTHLLAMSKQWETNGKPVYNRVG